MDIIVNGYIIKIGEVNSGAKETVFFIHGWPLSHKMFEYQWRELANKGIRCIGMDLIGYGESSKPWNGYDYDSLAELLNGVLTELKLTDITLLGFSMGGAIAARYIAKFGAQRIKKLILLSAACPSFTKRPDFPYGISTDTVNSLIKSVENDKPRAFAEFTGSVFDNDISPEFANWFGNITNESAIWSAEKSLVALRDEDLRKDLEKINIPTAIFHGVKDTVCPFELAEQMNIRIKNSFVLPFDFSGHGIFYEERDKLNLAIYDFVSGSVTYPVFNQALQSADEVPDLDDAINQHYKFINKPLPYSYSALEPYIDEKTMYLHHDKHLQTYIDNLNAALEKYPEFHNWTLERLIIQLNKLPQEIRIAVERNAGGVYNHFFYFDGMTARQSPPSVSLISIINKNFGSFELFKKKMSDAAMSVFGSGYAWLVLGKNRELEIIITQNQDTPFSIGKKPILNIDVWEHAYYLKHYNKRIDYINDWFNVVDWHAAELRLM